MAKFLPFLVLLSLALGCKERALDLELPYAGDKLVLFSQIKAGDTLKMEVQKTYPPTGQYTYINGITNATVKLFDEKGYVETLKHGKNGLYTSATGLVWKENDSYRIEVEAPGFPKAITDFETMPAPPVILSYEFSKDIDSRSNAGTPSRELNIKIQDSDIEKPNYYMIIIKRVVGKETIGVNVFDLDKPSEFDDPCEFRYFGRFVFPDFCKVNGVLAFRKGLELTYTYSLNIDPKARDKIVVSTRQISKSYYEFCKTYYAEDDLIVAFKTPYPRYTNITGGYGIFAAYNEVEKEFVLKE
ncbi:hypothetical protein GCM10027275_29260 [Rhabdobacter roseus]|uniref:DUF4249 domain-containing protein n=1 Tax=Rhabdobacter roseus TaxID=1655419 RepID=A0A840TT87_9BACT|nr:DUF4249 domain-containing protein [Rhabdobacter roseus]MBB5284877.1 hypothetical protein [Rhabdobacter roseus]